MIAKKVLKILILTSVSFHFSSCSYLQNVSQTSIPESRGQVVTAESDKYVIFLFNFSNTFVEEVKTELEKKCPNGKVEGITSKTESVLYFPIILSKYVVSARGYCTTASSPQVKGKRKL